MPISRPIRWSATSTCWPGPASGRAWALECLGRTLDGQPLDLLTVGEAAAGKRICWAIARQHPGETNGGVVDGGIPRAVARRGRSARRRLRQQAVFHIVANMIRTAAGAAICAPCGGRNLNREWQEPSLARSPEVFLCARACRRPASTTASTSHGDEVMPYNFISAARACRLSRRASASSPIAIGRALMQASPISSRARLCRHGAGQGQSDDVLELGSPNPSKAWR